MTRINNPLENGSRTKGNVLIVDDNPNNLRLLAGMLTEKGYKVRPAPTGHLALLSVKSILPDLILLDIKMPDMDGYEVCRRLKADEKTRRIPVLFISGLSDIKDKIKGFSLGAVDYITKPIQQEEVLARVKTHVSLSWANKRLEKHNLDLQKEIMERKKAEKELKNSHDELNQALTKLKYTQAQMLQSEKMASIGQLAAGMAHEINNPTSFISSNLETLADYQEDVNHLIKQSRTLTQNLKGIISKKILPSVITQLVEQMASHGDEVDINFIQDDILDIIKECRQGTERIKNIVIDLKEFARPGEDKPIAVDINKGIESTLNIIRNEFKDKAVITKNFGDLPLVECYPRQLNQVFMNILVNAAHAIEEHGEIKIFTQTNDDGYVEIRIIDTGSGIAKEDLSKIFDPFFTTKDVGQGTGLGLNVAYNIVKMHNGTIEVESAPGKGSCFIIRIPFHSAGTI